MPKPRDNSLVETGILSADTLVKTGKAFVYSITIAYKGMTTGELITLIDGIDIEGDDEVCFIVSSTEGTITKEWPEGKEFDTGLFFNVGATTGAVFAEMTYR